MGFCLLVQPLSQPLDGCQGHPVGIDGCDGFVVVAEVERFGELAGHRPDGAAVLAVPELPGTHLEGLDAFDHVGWIDGVDTGLDGAGARRGSMKPIPQRASDTERVRRGNSP